MTWLDNVERDLSQQIVYISAQRIITALRLLVEVGNGVSEQIEYRGGTKMLCGRLRRAYAAALANPDVRELLGGDDEDELVR